MLHKKVLASSAPMITVDDTRAALYRIGVEAGQRPNIDQQSFTALRNWQKRMHCPYPIRIGDDVTIRGLTNFELAWGKSSKENVHIKIGNSCKLAVERLYNNVTIGDGCELNDIYSIEAGTTISNTIIRPNLSGNPILNGKKSCITRLQGNISNVGIYTWHIARDQISNASNIHIGSNVDLTDISQNDFISSNESLPLIIIDQETQYPKDMGDKYRALLKLKQMTGTEAKRLFGFRVNKEGFFVLTADRAPATQQELLSSTSPDMDLTYQFRQFLDLYDSVVSNYRIGDDYKNWQRRADLKKQVWATLQNARINGNDFVRWAANELLLSREACFDISSWISYFVHRP